MDHLSGKDLKQHDEKEIGASGLDKELSTSVEDEESISSHKNDDELARKEYGIPGSEDSVQDAQDDIPDDERRDLEAAKTTSRTVSVRNLESIPDGGSKAWLQVLGSFFLFFNSW